MTHQAVGDDSTSPKSSGCSRSTLRSARQSPPSAMREEAEAGGHPSLQAVRGDGLAQADQVDVADRDRRASQRLSHGEHAGGPQHRAAGQRNDQIQPVSNAAGPATNMPPMAAADARPPRLL